MAFADLYGTDLDTELGSADRTQLFTTVLRKRYVNEGQREFNYQTSCFVKRGLIPLTDATREYDLETVGVLADGDYLWPAPVGASLQQVDSAGNTVYVEGDEFSYTTEEALTQTRPNWRAESAGVPRQWYVRPDGGALYVGLSPAPDIPDGDTWTLFWPYVAEPADLTADADEPFTSGTARTSLRPYHRALLHYAAAQLEKLRKNLDGVRVQLAEFARYVAKYRSDQAPPRGTQIRQARNYRRIGSGRPLDPTREP